MTSVAKAARKLLLAVKIRFQFCQFMYYTAKLIFRMNENEWYSFHDILKLGCPEKVARDLLPVLVSIDRFETRVTIDPTEGTLEEGVQALREVFRDFPYLDDTPNGYDYRWFTRYPRPQKRGLMFLALSAAPA